MVFKTHQIGEQPVIPTLPYSRGRRTYQACQWRDWCGHDHLQCLHTRQQGSPQELVWRGASVGLADGDCCNRQMTHALAVQGSKVDAEVCFPFSVEGELEGVFAVEDIEAFFGDLLRDEQESFSLELDAWDEHVDGFLLGNTKLVDLQTKLHGQVQETFPCLVDWFGWDEGIDSVVRCGWSDVIDLMILDKAFGRVWSHDKEKGGCWSPRRDLHLADRKESRP